MLIHADATLHFTAWPLYDGVCKLSCYLTIVVLVKICV
jgi:hypothetical protein